MYLLRWSCGELHYDERTYEVVIHLLKENVLRVYLPMVVRIPIVKQHHESSFLKRDIFL